MLHVIILPDLGQTTNEAKILQWLKKPGEYVSRGEPLVSVETDKVNMDVESFESGYLRAVLVDEGAVVTALTRIAILTDSPDESIARPEVEVATAEPAELTAPAAEVNAGSTTIAAAPSARVLANGLGIELRSVTGTGLGGLVTRADVEQFADRQKTAPPATNFRVLAAMAETVIGSKREIPHFYASRDLTVTSAANWREAWNRSRPDLPISFNDIFVRCAAKALADVPRMNVSYRNGNYEQRMTADILIIVARESALALMPLPDMNAATWEEFLGTVKEAVGRWVAAQTVPLLAISNLGMFAVKQFAAIIPPGCTAILAIGAVREEPVAKASQVVVERVCTVTLSLDHRVVDGITAARFLERMQSHLDSL